MGAAIVSFWLNGWGPALPPPPKPPATPYTVAKVGVSSTRAVVSGTAYTKAKIESD